MDDCWKWYNSSEMPKPLNDLMYGFQLWVNLPQEYKMFPPRYRELKALISQSWKQQNQGKSNCGRFRKKIGGITELYAAIDFFDVKLWPDLRSMKP
jgi:redox-sensitive bicupin YhaK (pirin superfamily)